MKQTHNPLWRNSVPQKVLQETVTLFLPESWPIPDPAKSKPKKKHFKIQLLWVWCNAMQPTICIVTLSVTTSVEQN